MRVARHEPCRIGIAVVGLDGDRCAMLDHMIGGDGVAIRGDEEAGPLTESSSGDALAPTICPRAFRRTSRRKPGASSSVEAALVHHLRAYSKYGRLYPGRRRPQSRAAEGRPGILTADWSHVRKLSVEKPAPASQNAAIPTAESPARTATTRRHLPELFVSGMRRPLCESKSTMSAPCASPPQPPRDFTQARVSNAALRSWFWLIRRHNPAAFLQASVLASFDCAGGSIRGGA
jgi:hypothetical protein